MTVTASVEVIEGGTSRVVSVSRKGLLMGRAPKGGGLVLTSRSVSSQHAELYWQGDDLFIRDMGSSFGTRREGQQVTRPERLSDGDEVVLGGAAVLRVSITGAGFGAPLSELSDVSVALEPTAAPSEVKAFAIDMLPVAEQLYQATSFEDLGYRITNAAFENFRPSRVVLIEIEGAGERFRVLGSAGILVQDATFVSRTMVSEAVRRGVAHYREDGGQVSLESVVLSGASAAIAASVRPRTGRLLILYMDSLYQAEPLTWSHALSLQVFAAHAAGAFDALATRVNAAEEQRRFERLRRYFAPTVVEHILKGQFETIERPQNIDATVVFADLVGYTKLSERLMDDPERLMDLLNRWLDTGARAVIAQGGTLDKFIGDTVMSVFGAPLPMKSAELSAVRCALDMQESIAVIGREVGENLQITVGINSGRVLVGNIGSKRRLEYTVLGDTVNVASRLQGKARAGEILLGAETAARLWGLVEMEDAGTLELKNHEAVKAYRVLGLTAAALDGGDLPPDGRVTHLP